MFVVNNVDRNQKDELFLHWLRTFVRSVASLQTLINLFIFSSTVIIFSCLTCNFIDCCAFELLYPDSGSHMYKSFCIIHLVQIQNFLWRKSSALLGFHQGRCQDHLSEKAGAWNLFMYGIFFYVFSLDVVVIIIVCNLFIMVNCMIWHISIQHIHTKYFLTCPFPSHYLIFLLLSSHFFRHQRYWILWKK